MVPNGRQFCILIIFQKPKKFCFFSLLITEATKLPHSSAGPDSVNALQFIIVFDNIIRWCFYGTH